MMAAFLIPLSALAGAAVDVSRLYLIKVRLQQACDAGVLAGRKFMTDTSSSTLDSTASAQATAFFNNNFRAGWMGSTNVSFTPSKTADNRVSGQASATVPMTVMSMFKTPAQVINITCQARYDIADTDVIFVLDTTGSMACLPSDSDSACSSYVGAAGTTTYTRPADSSLGASSGSVNDSAPGYPGSTGYYVPEKSGSRIAALRTAVVDFYNTMAANVQTGTHIRYGFVTYTSTVNAGKAVLGVGPNYLIGGSGSGVSTYNYPSRSVVGDYTVSTSSNTYTGLTQNQCNNYNAARSPSTANTYNSSGTASQTTASYSTSTDRKGNVTTSCVVTQYTLGPQWKYQTVPFDVSRYLVSNSIDDPSKVDSSSAAWAGCLEQPGDSSAGQTTFDLSNLPPSLDPNLSTNAQWAPMFPEVIYGRNYTGSGYGFSSTGTVTANGDPSSSPRSYWTYSNQSMMKSGYITCGKPVRRLSTMTLQDVTNYVNATDFRAIGGTYHDTGMIWGVRMLSPSGIFANDTAAWSGRPAPNRVIVFLTDGTMAPSTMIYGMYGIEYFDRRASNGDFANLTDYHNDRFLAECAEARSLGISVWTVALGMSSTNELTQCATKSSQALATTSGSGLSDAFKSIAAAVAQLRISQ